MAAGVAFFHPVCKPLASLSKAMPLSSYLFTVSGDPTTQALVYKDAYRRVPYRGNPVADAAGNFEPIYLDPLIQYSVQLVDQNGVAQYPAVDPYLPPCPTTGTGIIQINPLVGEVSIGPPIAGSGGDAALQLARNGSFALNCPGNAGVQGAPLLQFINCLAVGTTQVNYTNVNNKPGGAFTLPTSWLPILGDGGITYYIPLWS